VRSGSGFVSSVDKLHFCSTMMLPLLSRMVTVTRNGQRLALAGLLSLLVAGCGGSSGFLRGSVTQVQVQHGDFRVVKTSLHASAETGKVFCLIPTDDGQVYRHAMEDLHAWARLKPNQMLVNIREDRKVMVYFFYCTSTLTLSADVIEFSSEGKPPLTASPGQ